MRLFNFCKKQVSKPISLPGNFFKKLLFTGAAIGIIWVTADVVCNPEKARNELKGYDDASDALAIAITAANYRKIVGT